MHASAYVDSIRQHTSAYVSIRQPGRRRGGGRCVSYIYICVCIYIHTYIHAYIHTYTFIRMLTYASYVYFFRDAHLPAALLAAYRVLPARMLTYASYVC